MGTRGWSSGTRLRAYGCSFGHPLGILNPRNRKPIYEKPSSERTTMGIQKFRVLWLNPRSDAIGFQIRGFRLERSWERLIGVKSSTIERKGVNSIRFKTLEMHLDVRIWNKIQECVLERKIREISGRKTGEEFGGGSIGLVGLFGSMKNFPIDYALVQFRWVGGTVSVFAAQITIGKRLPAIIIIVLPTHCWLNSTYFLAFIPFPLL
jgi:hypothetical protein